MKKWEGKFIKKNCLTIKMEKKKNKCNETVWDKVEKHMKNPDYVKEVYEFIRLTS